MVVPLGIHLCIFDIFDGNYIQMKGDSKIIRGYHSSGPSGWGP